MSRPGILGLMLGLLLVASGGALAATVPLVPAHDHQVLQALGPRAASRTDSLPQALAAARRAIGLSRELADPRYLGQAQAALSRWWLAPDAPVDVLVLRATVEQSRHEFSASRQTLLRVIGQDAAHAQALLTLSSLDKLQGRYTAALEGCRRLSGGGQSVHGRACELEAVSLMGEHRAAGQGFAELLALRLDAATASWIWSLRAENDERAGLDADAMAGYRRSLAAQADPYTTLALADLLLRRGDAPAALKVLALAPDSDATLLRRARALRMAGDARWRETRDTLARRFEQEAATARGGAAHGRELAYFRLWLHDDPAGAAQPARANLVEQREFVDWWLALESARQSRDPRTLTPLREQLAASGLRDARLATYLSDRMN